LHSEKIKGTAAKSRKTGLKKRIMQGKESYMPNTKVALWVDEMAKLCKPDKIYWCDGSEEEKKRLTQDALKTGELHDLNQEKLPGCYLHRSHQNDVARTEHLTFICTPTKDEAGPTNNWMAPAEAYDKLGKIFDGSMKGRTMYVIPFLMGSWGSPYAKIGVELTDSLYVVLNMRILTRIGNRVWDLLGDSDRFTRCLHARADLDLSRRFICHFPQDNTIWSVGSAYGGNVLLGKKCLALRLASYMGRNENWMAEHMLILGVEDPSGKTTYIAAAFPSACGKTNLAMMVPPPSQTGYKIWTVGDDIAWLHIGKDGRLWAVNPEAGFFGVAPGTNRKSNPNAMASVEKNAIFTNVLKRPDGTVWWEGMDGEVPAEGIDWKGEKWTPSAGTKGANPNSRFTAPASQCPSISPEWENPEGVPISAILFGSRRTHLTPLIYEAFNWQHGTFIGASMASETTAAAQGAVGVLRRDPMAMLPFCGYNMGDYFAHWLKMGALIKNPPKIFCVNWFRQDASGRFLWPGFGENIRVLRWIIERTEGKGSAAESPVGLLPGKNALCLDGLDLSAKDLEQLLDIKRTEWQEEASQIEKFFGQFGDHLPAALGEECRALHKRLRE